MQHKSRTPDYQINIDSLGFLLLQKYIFCHVLDIWVVEVMESYMLTPRAF